MQREIRRRDASPERGCVVMNFWLVVALAHTCFLSFRITPAN
jgi:hypothetical protein